MFEKLLNEYLFTVAGTGAEKVLTVLFNKQNVNEFLIAKKLDLTINQTRNVLYKLADKGLVRFIRKKDLKSGGWYTYFWTLDEYKCLINYKGSILKEIGDQQGILEAQKTKQFYYCKVCNVEVSGEQALSNEFTCVECGEVYSLKDFVESVKNAEKNIIKLKDKLSKLQEEIDKLSVLRKKQDKPVLKIKKEKKSVKKEKKSSKKEKKKVGKSKTQLKTKKGKKK